MLRDDPASRAEGRNDPDADTGCLVAAPAGCVWRVDFSVSDLGREGLVGDIYEEMKDVNYFRGGVV